MAALCEAVHPFLACREAPVPSKSCSFSHLAGMAVAYTVRLLSGDSFEAGRRLVKGRRGGAV